MLKINRPSPNRLDLELAGTLDSTTMRIALEDLIAQSEGIENGRMLYAIPEFSMPTFGAIAIEIQLMPKLFGLLGKFNRCAVLSDESWLRTAAEIEGALIPGIAIKAFALDATEEAEAWLEEEDD